MENSNIIEISQVSMTFPGVKALDNVNLSIRQGEIHAIVGENGAGKSTLMKILSGVYQPTEGKLHVDGEEVRFNKPQDATKHGIGIIHQEFSLVPYLSGVENIFLGREMKKGPFLDKAGMIRRAKGLLSALKADFDVTLPVCKLSVANQQFVEIAKATSQASKILIFDEPTAALTGNEIETLFDLIFHLKEQGTTILYISHHLEEIFRISDRYSVLRDGAYIGTRLTKGSTQEEMVKMMVGREIEAEFPPRRTPLSDEVVLNVKDLDNEKVNHVHFKLHRGEIIGLAGLVGAGRTEIVRALFGADPCSTYDVEINGEPVHIKSTQDALKCGFGLIPEDRKNQGLILGMSIKGNVTISVIKELSNTLHLTTVKKENALVNKSIDELRIKTPSMNQEVQYLSGGNQQKVVLAKWMNTDSKILIFDEPTRGIDIGAKDEIYKLIRELSESGISIILVSSELAEIMGLSDRIFAIYNGSIAAEMNASEASPEAVMYKSAGGKQT